MGRSRPCFVANHRGSARADLGDNCRVRVTYVLVIHGPAEGVELFQRYEAAVLPLLSEHGGALERRL